VNQSITFQTKVHFRRGRAGQKRLSAKPAPSAPSGRVPRVAKLMALAIRFDSLVRAGDVTDYADLARLGHVTRARITQIMNLLRLAPDIQEKILFLPHVTAGRDLIHLRQLQPITLVDDWQKQRRLWAALADAELRTA
jgi:hypothetical protein